MIYLDIKKTCKFFLCLCRAIYFTSLVSFTGFYAEYEPQPAEGDNVSVSPCGVGEGPMGRVQQPSPSWLGVCGQLTICNFSFPIHYLTKNNLLPYDLTLL